MEVKRITIVGCGPGSADYIHPAARAAIEQAEIFVAACNIHALFPTIGAERITMKSDVGEVLEAMERHLGKRIVVGVSGDPGIASLARPILERFGRDCCSVIPGVSSIQVACARLGLDWTHARIINAHTRVPMLDPSLDETDVIAILAGKNIAWVADFLKNLPAPRSMFLCENLTLADERIRQIHDYTSIASSTISTRTIVLLIKKEVL